VISPQYRLRLVRIGRMRHLSTILPLIAASAMPLFLSSCGRGGSDAKNAGDSSSEKTADAPAYDPYAEAIKGHSLVGDLEFPVVFRHPEFEQSAKDSRRTIVFYTDDGAHGWLQHENTAAAILLGQRLAEAVTGSEVVVLRDSFPDADLLDRAAAVVFYCSGTEHHPFNDSPNREAWQAALGRGIGAVAIHWMLEAGNPEAEALVAKSFGGIFELDFSVNPMWMGKFPEITEHEITRGMSPFEVYDEYYFNIRFPEGLPGTRTNVLEAIPPKRVFLPEDGPRSNNPHVRATQGRPHVIAWTYLRPGDARSFAFTGGHFHWVLKQDDYRRLLLNGIAWAAGIDVPDAGIPDTTPNDQELMAHQDSPSDKAWRPMPGQPPFDPAPN